MATATIGDNSEKAARERRLKFSYYHQKDRDIDARIQALMTEKKTNRQNAKAAGIPSQKLDHYLKAFKAEDQQKPVDRLLSDKENLEWQGLIPPTLGKDLLAQGDRADGEQLVQARGFSAGLNKLPRVSPYGPGSSDERMWLESYDMGFKEYDTDWPEIFAKMQAEQTKEEPAPSADGSDPFGDD